jgi:hypothetical protein
LLPAFDSGEHLVRIGGPDEWHRVFIGVGEEAVDRGLEVRQGSEHAPLEATLGEFGKKAFRARRLRSMRAILRQLSFIA